MDSGAGQGRCSREGAGPGGLPLGAGEAGPGEPWAQGWTREEQKG